MKKNKVKSESGGRIRNLWFPLRTILLVILFFQLAQPVLAGSFGNSVIIGQQKRTITGVVNDSSGMPIPGVSIVVKGTTIGAVTDTNGKFSITVNSDSKSLLFSFVGMKMQEVALGGSSNLIIKMEDDSIGIEEVVAVGYGTQKKANLTGAVGMVSSERLEERPIVSTSQGLQGLIPNLNITIFNGDPTKAADFNIRGFESINGGSPLILVDGVPMDLDRINPQDIKSINVLKDAAAAAVYGARAAFGVILVETKKGEGKINVRLSSELSMDVPIFNVDPITNSWDYVQAKNSMQLHSSGTPAYNDSYLAAVKAYWEDPQNNPEYAVVNGAFEFYGNNNYAKELMSTNSPHQKYDLSVSGSTEKSRFYTSFGYLNTDGYLKVGNDNFKRYNILMKADFKINEWLDIDQKISLNSQVSDKPHFYSNDVNINSIIRVEPNRPIHVPLLQGYEQYEGMYWDGLNFFPYLEQGGRNKFSNTDTWLSSGITLSPLKGFKIRTDFSYNILNQQRETGAPRVLVLNPNITVANPVTFGYSGNDFVSTESNYNQYYVFNSYAEYLLDYIPNHYFKAMVGFNQEWGRNSFVNGRAASLVATNIIDIGATTGTQTVTGGKNHTSLRGAFYRLNYIYKDKYLVEANGRYDGTSRFPKDDRFGFFPSVSVGWRLSSEGFMAATRSVIDDLKIRASYGTLGNQLLGDRYYPYISTMNIGSSNYQMSSGLIPMIQTPGLVSPSLTWETVVSKNLGLDIALFDQKFDASFDVYTRETKDMLMRKTYPSILGTTAPDENAADLKTTGWELAINWRDNITKDLKYTLTFSLSDWVSEITKYDNPTGALGQYRVGQEIGEIWGFETVGIIQDDAQLASMADQSRIATRWRLGDIEYKDQNIEGEEGYGLISIGQNTLADPGDQKIIGNTNPRYSFGLNSGLTYKDFSVSAFFQGIGKRDYYPSTASWTWFFPWQSFNGEKSWLTDTWSEDNRDAYFPKPGGSNNFISQTRFLQDASYIRLKSLTISYDLPELLVKKVGLSGAKFYVAGNNLWEYSRIRKPLDPEYIFSNSIDYPLLRTYSAGVIINL